MRRLEEFRNYMGGCLKEGPLLVCYLDGFGYEMYRWARGQENLLMEKEFHIEPVQSVEPPLTNAAMATILTGTLPSIHRIVSHQDRQLTLPTIFDEYDGKSLFLEGDMRILHTSQKAVLHTDCQGKTGDEWIWEDVQKGIDKGYTFLFAHFHGIDDAGHRHGPYSPAVLEQIRITDGHLKECRKRFKGRILLISDHGMYLEGNQGIHGVNGSQSSPGHRKREEIHAIWGESIMQTYSRKGY